MIVDGDSVADNTVFEADVCVVGAGAAGMTLALDLAQRGVEVLLIESGGLEWTKASHELLDVELSGHSNEQLVNHTRERFFGGTTNHWGGEIRTLSAFEFEPHAWVPHSGWPISRKDLDPYYVAAAKLLGLPEVDRPFDPAALGFGESPRLVRPMEPDIEAQLWGRVPPERLRFGQSRREETRNSATLRCVLNTTVAVIHPEPTRQRIVSMEARTFGGKTLHFRAKDFALCTGAIENARLLLASDAAVPRGLGNEHDLVGRYFMDHGAIDIGPLLITDAAAGPFQEELIAENNLVGWATTPEARTKHQLQGFMAIQWPKATPLRQPIEYSQGIASLARGETGENPQTPPRHLNVVINWEQAPNPLSRVMLSGKRDALGVRKPILHWDVTATDLASARRSSELLSLAVARSGYARLRRLQNTPGSPLTKGGGHQMGTTRMSVDPRQGVTDHNGRVHSLQNLYIGGSSLFPTGGWQNPTFTIMALALRLSDLLATRSTRATSV
ncbi:MAG: GMC family oxidoreductase [Halioglobus sp.]